MPLERQVNFKIPAEDEHLLDNGAREYGSIKAAIIAGLRVLEEQRLARAPKPDPGPAPPPEPPPGPAPTPSGSNWWPTEDLGAFLGVKRSTIHRWASQGRVHLRGSGAGEEADLATLRLERSRAAELCGIKSATLGRWVEDGRAQADDDGLFALGELTVPPARARGYGLTPAQCERLDVGGAGHVRLLDVIDLALEDDDDS